MIYVGLDMSLTCTGVCVLDNSLEPVSLGADSLVFCYQPRGGLVGVPRLLWYAEEVDKLLLRLTTRFPGEEIMVAVEDYAFDARNASAHIGELGGVVKTTCYNRLKQAPLPFSPGAVKKFATGKGNSPKSVMVVSVFKKWKLDVSDFGKAAEDAADAIAVAKLLGSYDQWKKGHYAPQNKTEAEVFGAKDAVKVKKAKAARTKTSVKDILAEFPEPPK